MGVPTSRNDSEQRSSNEIMSHFWFETTTTKRQIIPHTCAVSFSFLICQLDRGAIGSETILLVCKPKGSGALTRKKNSGQKRMIPHRSNRVSRARRIFSALPVWNPSLRGISRGEKPDWPRMRRGDPMIFGPGPRRDSSCGFQSLGTWEKTFGKSRFFTAPRRKNPPRRPSRSPHRAPH